VRDGAGDADVLVGLQSELVEGEAAALAAVADEPLRSRLTAGAVRG
jgi:hypothetical protein